MRPPFGAIDGLEVRAKKASPLYPANGSVPYCLHQNEFLSILIDTRLNDWSAAAVRCLNIIWTTSAQLFEARQITYVL